MAAFSSWAGGAAGDATFVGDDLRGGSSGAAGSSEGGVAATTAAVLKPPFGSAAGLASLGWRRASSDASSLPDDETGVAAVDVFGFFCVGVGILNGRRVPPPRFICSQRSVQRQVLDWKNKMRAAQRFESRNNYRAAVELPLHCVRRVAASDAGALIRRLKIRT